MSEQEAKPYDPNADFNADEPEIDRSVAAQLEQERQQLGGGIPIDTGKGIAPLALRDTADLKSLVRVIVRGGCVPEGYLMKDNRNNKVPDMSKMAVGILAGRERGWGPLTSLMYIMIVRGMPSVWGKGAKGLVYASNKVSDYRLTWIDYNTLTETNSEAKAKELQEAGHLLLHESGGRYVLAKYMRPPIENMNLATWPGELCAYVIGRRAGVETPFVGVYSVAHAKKAKLWLNAKKFPWMDSPTDMLEHRAAARVWDRGFSDCLVGLALMDPAEDEPQVIGPADTSFLGTPQIAAPEPEHQERDMLMGGLEKVTEKAGLDMWFMAAEERMKALQASDPAGAAAINEAYLAKKAAFETGAGAS